MGCPGQLAPGLCLDRVIAAKHSAGGRICMGLRRNASLPISKIFNDQSSPRQVGMLNCTGVAGPNPNNVGWHNIPNVSNQVTDAMQTPPFVLNALKQLRALRIEPPMNRPAVSRCQVSARLIQGGTEEPLEHPSRDDFTRASATR